MTHGYDFVSVKQIVLNFGVCYNVTIHKWLNTFFWRIILDKIKGGAMSRRQSHACRIANKVLLTLHAVLDLSVVLIL